MQSRFMPRFAGAVLIALCLSLAPLARAQEGLCQFDPNVGQGPAKTPPLQAVPWYLVWQAGKVGDQQSAITDQHSGLVAWAPGGAAAAVDDEDFADGIAVAELNRDNFGNNYQLVPMVYVFGECYGGGMVDELEDELPNPMSIVTASFYNQTSYYPKAGGNGLDFVWAYVQALAAQLPATSAQALAVQASHDDPWGWAPQPTPARNGETLGSETPEYFSQNNGDQISLNPAQYPRTSIVLWAGRPNQVDDAQLANTLLLLLQAGYSKDDILILFGSGTPSYGMDQNGKFIPTLVQQAMQSFKMDPTHMRAATLKQFNAKLQEWMFPKNVNNPPRFFFFLAADHGCNNAFLATLKDGDGGNPVQDYGNYGSGDDDDEIYPPRN